MKMCNKRVKVMRQFSFFSKQLRKSSDSSVGIVTGYGLDDRGPRVRFPAQAGNFSLHCHVQTGSGAHPAPYPMGTGSSFPGDKAAGAWSWPLTSRMRGVTTPLRQYVFMLWYLGKHRNQLKRTPSSLPSPDRLWAHPASYTMGKGVLPPGVQLPRRETDHSPPSSAEVNNEWSYTSTPHVFMVS
jgi:hypothetical protein